MAGLKKKLQGLTIGAYANKGKEIGSNIVSKTKDISGFDSVSDAMYNAVGSKNVKDLVLKQTGANSIKDLVTDYAALGASTAVGLTPLGVPLQMLTGKTTADLLGYNAKTGLGKNVEKVTGFIPSAQRAIGGGLMSVAGVPGGTKLASSGLKSETGNAQGLNNDQTEAEQPIFENGGEAGSVMINVEKDELCVNPHTMEVMDDYKDLPPHPKGKDNINQKGNVKVIIGSVIIPADMREKFMKGKQADKEGIIKMLVERQAKDKAERGGYVGGIYKAKNGFVFNPNQTSGYSLSGGTPQPMLGTQGLLGGTTTTNTTTGQSTYTSPTNQMLSGGGSMGQYLGLLGQAIPQYLLGKKQYDESQKALEALSKTPAVRYAPTAELQQQGQDVLAARERAQYGFTPAQLAANAQNVARAENTQYQRYLDVGGAGLSGAVSAGMASNKMDAINQQALESAKLQQAKQLSAEQAQRMYAGSVQGLANQQVAVDQANRLRQEQAYGKAMQKGLENKYGAYGTAGAVAGSALGTGLSGGDSSAILGSLLKLLA